MSDFLTAFKGRFVSTLRWPQLDELWKRLRQDADAGWYLYTVGSPPPSQPTGEAGVSDFIDEIDGILRSGHKEDYCGIVYADDLHNPSLVKIYDPGNLGVTCGYSDNPPPPGWVMSKLPPADILPPVKKKKWQIWSGLGHKKSSPRA
jgi:hypothetical protein